MAELSLEIGGTPRTFEEHTLSFDDSLNGRDRLRVSIRSATAEFEPSEGQSLTLLDGATLIFDGIIQKIAVEQEGDSDFLIHEVDAEDYSGLFDRRLVARVYDNQTVGAIVSDIVAQDVTGEGLTTTGVETGPTIDKAVFNYLTAAEALNELAEKTGMAWWVAPDKVLNFRARASLSGTAITATNIARIRVTTQREHYRNRQTLRAGTDLTAALPEVLVGDGDRQVFNVSLPVGKAPTVEENIAGGGYVAKTVGIAGMDTGKDWYWNKSHTEITQDTGGTVLTTADKLRVTFQGRVPIIVQGELNAEIVARAAVEGGSGIHEARDDRPDIDDLDLATDTTNALLARHGSIGRTITVETLVSGYRAGQLVAITHARHGLAGETFLVSAVRGRDWLGLDQSGSATLLYSLTLIEGDPVIGWRDFYRRLLSSRREFVIRDTEILNLLKVFMETVSVTEALVTATAAGESRINHARIGSSEIAA